MLDPDDLVEELALVLGPPHGPVGHSVAKLDAVLELIGGHGEVSVDAVAAQMKLPVAEVLVRVVGLEAAGLVEFDGVRLRANGH